MSVSEGPRPRTPSEIDISPPVVRVSDHDQGIGAHHDRLCLGGEAVLTEPAKIGGSAIRPLESDGNVPGRGKCGSEAIQPPPAGVGSGYLRQQEEVPHQWVGLCGLRTTKQSPRSSTRVPPSCKRAGSVRYPRDFSSTTRSWVSPSAHHPCSTSVQAQHRHEGGDYRDQLRSIETPGEIPQSGLRINDGELLDHDASFHSVEGAHQMDLWAARQLSAEHMELLAGLPHPVTVEVNGFGPVLFCTAPLVMTGRWSW